MHAFEHDFYGHDMSVLVLGYIRPELDYVSKGMCMSPSRDGHAHHVLHTIGQGLSRPPRSSRSSRPPRPPCPRPPRPPLPPLLHLLLPPPAFLPPSSSPSLLLPTVIFHPHQLADPTQPRLPQPSPMHHHRCPRLTTPQRPSSTTSTPTWPSHSTRSPGRRTRRVRLTRSSRVRREGISRLRLGRIRRREMKREHVGEFSRCELPEQRGGDGSVTVTEQYGRRVGRTRGHGVARA
jgi:hypothetical protein